MQSTDTSPLATPEIIIIVLSIIVIIGVTTCVVLFLCYHSKNIKEEIRRSTVSPLKKTDDFAPVVDMNYISKITRPYFLDENIIDFN